LSVFSGRPYTVSAQFGFHLASSLCLAEAGAGQAIGWRKDGGEILVATLSGHIVVYPVTTEVGFSHGEPTTLVRILGCLAVYTTPMQDHSRLLIRVSPDAAQDRGRCGCSLAGRMACARATGDDCDAQEQTRTL
jgi:hypothetical protein